MNLQNQSEEVSDNEGINAKKKNYNSTLNLEYCFYIHTTLRFSLLFFSSFKSLYKIKNYFFFFSKIDNLETFLVYL